MDLYNIDRSIPDVRMLPRLTEFHVTPDKIPLMKVKNAAQVLNHRVASIMLFLSSRLKKNKNNYTLDINIYIFYVLGKNILDKSDEGTSKLCLFFDQLFDSVNGSSQKIFDGKVYRTAVKRQLPHHKVWENSLKTMYFIDPITKKRRPECYLLLKIG